MILARTVKGKGISLIEGKGGWHGKPLKKGEELDKALAELKAQVVPEDEPAPGPEQPVGRTRPDPKPARLDPPSYKLGDSVATREAYGTALARLGAADARIVALDADVKNSTFSDRFEQQLRTLTRASSRAGDGRRRHGTCRARRDSVPVDVRPFLARATIYRMAAISNQHQVAGRCRGVDWRRRPSQRALEIWR